MKDVLRKIVGAEVKDIVKLHGDASYRTYFRAYFRNGETRVVMQMPEGRSSASEEITNFRGNRSELPFINVARFLGSQGLPVPKIYHYDEATRLMILEDVGDEMLINLVKDADAAERMRWYKKAVDLLVALQEKTLKADKASCIALQRSFDEELLNWEFDHFKEYFIEARGGCKMKPSDAKIFKRETRAITEEILKIPQCFTHRDFQSKNLMVLGGELVMIDFQDALMGPCVYDLVALLRDSYVELEWEMVEELMEYYWEKMLLKKSSFTLRASIASREANGNLASRQARRLNFANWFDLVTLQRKMKDAGRFIYIDRVKKNPNFLQYIPTTLKYVKNAFERTIEPSNHRTIELCEALQKYVPEWQ